MIRAFRTSIWTLGSGSLLIAAAALSREESLRSCFVAKTESTAARAAWIGRLETADLAPAQNLDHFDSARVEILSPPVADANRNTAIASADENRTPAKHSAVFHNASLRTGPKEASATIQFGPLTSAIDQSPDDRSAQEPLVATAPSVVMQKPEASLPAAQQRGELETRPDHHDEALVARLYHPNAMTVSDLERLIRPLLTPGVGTATVSKGDAAGETSIDGDVDENGLNDNPSNNGKPRRPELLIVRDRPQVMRQIDALYSELDAAPKRVVIDAVIADVTLPDSVPLGSELQQSRFGLVEAEPQAVLRTLRSLGYASVIATNQLHVVDHQWAELAWTQRACEASASGQAIPSVQDSSLRLATKFRIRPSLQSNGLIRLEVHPQSGRLKQGARSERAEMTTVAFTTDLMLHAGTTAVIAGSVDDRPVDERAADVDRLPSPGQLVMAPGDSPAIHPRPRVRRETVLLVMPRIVPEN